jgi:hypothetical protein
LNPKCTPARRVGELLLSVTKIGPLSRSHESSIGSTTISTAPGSAARASAAAPSSAHTTVSGSNEATAVAVAA